MSHTCYFITCGRFCRPATDAFKWQLFSLLAELDALDYTFCRDYLRREIPCPPKEEDKPWSLILPGDAIVILADTSDPAHRARLDALAGYARDRGVEPRFCLAP